MVLRFMVKKRLLVESTGPVSGSEHANRPFKGETANRVAVPAFKAEALNDC